MKKCHGRFAHPAKKLELHRETLRGLDPVQLSEATGALDPEPSWGIAICNGGVGSKDNCYQSS